MKFKKYHKSKNLIVYPYYDKSGTISNVLWTVSEDGHIKGVGTTSSGTNFFLNRDIFLKAGTYTIKIYGKHTGMTFCIYDSVKQTSIVAISSSSTDGFRTFTLDSDTSNECRVYFNADGAGQNVDIDCDIMLNEGSTPQPYEPYSSEVWHDIPYYQHKTATDTLTLPAVIYPNDTSITVGIKGQSSQSGTPTPDNPIMPEGTGERTGNLCNPNLTRHAKAYSEQGIVDFAGGATYLLPIKANTTYTVKIYSNDSISVVRVGLYNNDTPINGTFVSELQQIDNLPNPTATVTNTDYKYLYLQIAGSYINRYGLSQVMINTGSTALPYENFGYKIPISMGGTTTPVYLGEVQTTRKIKKLVLTGEEDYYVPNISLRVPIGIYIPTITGAPLAVISSHFQTKNSSEGTQIDSHLYTIRLGQSGGIIWFFVPRDFFSGGLNVDNCEIEYKEWLRQQYSAGTPVTVWYVLATPQTAIVNEPLMKIDTYADSLTTSIPVTAGENTLDVQTTVQPSEVTAGFSGWHPVQSVHERENGQWD